MGIFTRRDGPLVMKEQPTGATRTRTETRLLGLIQRVVVEDEMVADIVYGGAGYVDTDTITYWKRRN